MRSLSPLRALLLAGGCAAIPGLAALAPGAPQPQRVKVVVPPMAADQLAELRQAVPTAELVVAQNTAEAVRLVADADACYGFGTPEVVRAGKKLRWMQCPSAGVEGYIFPELVNSSIVLTNAQRLYAPEIADQAMAYLLSFTRSLPHFAGEQRQGSWGPREGVLLDELQGKTMVIVGFGGIGTEIARRANAFGVRVLATDPKVTEKPDFLAELHKPADLHRLLPQADILVSAVPITPVTRKMIGDPEFALLKPTTILINVSRGGVVDTDALVRALREKRIAAAGLDVSDPEPLPKGHPLWQMANVILTPHTAGTSPGGFRRVRELFKENLRRFAAGETLKNVVDKQAGY
jgi:phosphoglycerate dehydrogenase-like enzyme